MRKTQHRRRGKLKLAVLAVILLTAALLLSVRISEITVTGNERYTKEELTQILFPDQWSRNSLFCFLRDRLQEHVQIPFVEDYELVFQGLGKVEVIVYEKSVCVCRL